MTPAGNKLKWKVFLFLITLSLLINACTTPGLVERYLPQKKSAADVHLTVETTFFVRVPSDTPTDETIYLSTLDEVTGLGVNPQAHPLELVTEEPASQGGLTYKTTLVVPQNSLIKYRYTRQDPYSVIEHTDTGEQVRYRLLHAQNPAEVHDVVYQWSDTSY